MSTHQRKYIGEIDVSNNPEYQKTPQEFALEYIEIYGGIDGAHHKDWLIDQVARILQGAPVTIKLAKWSNGQTEIRYHVGTCEKYENWVQSFINEGYSYDTGIAP